MKAGVVIKPVEQQDYQVLILLVCFEGMQGIDLLSQIKSR